MTNRAHRLGLSQQPYHGLSTAVQIRERERIRLARGSHSTVTMLPHGNGHA